MLQYNFFFKWTETLNHLTAYNKGKLLYKEFHTIHSQVNMHHGVNWDLEGYMIVEWYMKSGYLNHHCMLPLYNYWKSCLLKIKLVLLSFHLKCYNTATENNDNCLMCIFFCWQFATPFCCRFSNELSQWYDSDDAQFPEIFSRN